ncbi:MAG: YVTN family beta-propeller protein [Planctomycetota bacterium]|jgi:YVTN family beta-propeller protein
MIRSLLFFVATCLLSQAGVRAQSFGPGLGNLTYDPSELFQPLAVFQHPNGYTSSMMVHGWFMTVAAGDNTVAEKAIEFWDLSDPRNPTLAHSQKAGAALLSEAHTYSSSSSASYGKDYIAFMSSGGFSMWDVSDPSNVTRDSLIQLPGTSSAYGAIFWLFWAPPYVYVPGADSGLYIVRVDDPANPQYVKTIPPSQLGGIAPNQVFICGNLMILMRSQQLGFATFDISDPENPIPIQVVSGAQGYSHIFAAGKILTSGGDGGPVQMFVHDVSPTGIMTPVGSVGSGFSNGAYGSYQDGFFHTGMSNAYAKFDIANLQTVGTATTNIANRDEDQCQVFGNLAFVGDDHGVGSGLYVHDTQPDSNGPDVHWVHPPDGAEAVPLTGRVGVSMSDSVDFLSVDSTTFTVRPLGGVALPGKYSVQMGIANFSPDAPLNPNTLYEVIVDGIEDYVGNSGAVFQSTFTTESNVVGAPPVGPASIDSIVATSGTAYTMEPLNAGDLLYVDRTYTYDVFPTRFRGQVVIQTANDDKSMTGSNFLSFNANESVEVNVLFDDRATSLPAWLQDFSTTGELFSSSCGAFGRCDFDVYTREFPAGTVSLGGNGDPPVAGAGSMYTAIVLPSGASPTCDTLQVSAVETGSLANFSAGNVSGAGPFSFTWNFGDGSQTSSPSSSPDASHTYAMPGRYPVVLTIVGANGGTACSAIQIVHEPLTPNKPTRSSPIASDGTRVYVVNPDNDSVTAIDEATLSVDWEAPVGDSPRTLALASNGELWVVNQESHDIDVLDVTNGALIRTIPLPRGSRPYGVVFRPDAAGVFVSLESGTPKQKATSNGRVFKQPLTQSSVSSADAAHLSSPQSPAPQIAGLLEIDPTSGAIRRSAILGGKARGLAVSADSSRVFVTRFLTTHPRRKGVVWELNTTSLALVESHLLRFDPGPDTERSGRGAPNYLTALAISPSGLRLLVPSKKDNIERGLFRDGLPLNFENRVRTIVSQIDLVQGVEDESARLDLNDRDLAQAVAYSPLGDLFAVASQGSNRIDVFDATSGTQYATWLCGQAPQGLVFSNDGSRLYVKNFIGRSVTVLDTSQVVSGVTYAAPQMAEVLTVAAEVLSTQVLQGKRIFYDASDRRMNLDGYLSCATCHLDGGSDGQTWDFTQSGEGLRNTITLEGRSGLGHGNVHWTANFDEIQDFENDIRNGFLGVGFLLNSDFAATANPLGATKAGLNPDLDALSDYVSSLDSFSQSPFRNPDGSLTPAALRGQVLFNSLNCSSCHIPPAYTDGLRHDVGTILPSSGLGIGQPLNGAGFETPTLRSVWKSGPYLHDGRASSLEDALSSESHGGTNALTQKQRSDLAAWLRQIE